MTMLEKIARAISTDLTGEVHDFELYLETASAVLEAMKEPTEGMVIDGTCAAGEDLARLGERPNLRRPALDAAVLIGNSKHTSAVFYAMINAALEGK